MCCKEGHWFFYMTCRRNGIDVLVQHLEQGNRQQLFLRLLFLVTSNFKVVEEGVQIV